MSVYVSFQSQKEQDAELTVKAMATQLGINLGISLAVLAGFSFLRPRHTLVYAPKFKFSTENERPPAIGPGWFDWIRPVMQAKDDFLMDRIGFDAVMFLRFLRLLRRLFLVMSVVGICGLIPINIVATYKTGDWPPPPGLDVLSISGINYTDDNVDTRWFWSPATATWLFSILIAYFMYRASCDYVDMRQRYFRHTSQLSGRSLLLHNLPHEVRSDDQLKKWVQGMTHAVPYPIQDAIIGHDSQKLTKLTQEHEAAVKRLEDTLSSYLQDGKALDKKKRPTVRRGGFLGFGGRKVDAIETFTQEVDQLEKEIKTLRRKKAHKASSYGWISFERLDWAHQTDQALHTSLKHAKQEAHVRVSPPPKDLVWPNLPLDDKKRAAKRWIGRAAYWLIVFIWMIPVGALSATSNVVNIIRMLPNSEDFIKSHAFLMGIIQGWFTPIVMAIFFFVLPHLFRFLSQQQGYLTQTSLDRKVLVKLYVFFIINNLCVFTLATIIIGIYGQIRSLILSGTVTADTSIANNVVQLAKNISDVSTFWIDYVCIKALGITMEMAQVLPLLLITLRKWITRPSPRKLRALAQPPEFDYPQGYNLLLFFFTIALLYSCIAPLVLPFALLYFSIGSVVYKYMLMYISVTKVESGGRIWPVLFQTVLSSTVLFQLLMILILALKGGYDQAYMLIPLPILTVAYQYFYAKRIHKLGSHLVGTWNPSMKADLLSKEEKDMEVKKKEKDLKHQFRDPAMHKKLLTPIIHDDVKHLLPQIYHSQPAKMIHENIEMVGHHLDLDTQHGFQKADKRMTMVQMEDNDLGTFKFATMTEQEAIDQEEESSSSEDEEEQREADVPQSTRAVPSKIIMATRLDDTSSLGRSELSDEDDERRGLVQDYSEQQDWQYTYSTALQPPLGLYSQQPSEEKYLVGDTTLPEIRIDDSEKYEVEEEEEEDFGQQDNADERERTLRRYSAPIAPTCFELDTSERRRSLPQLSSHTLHERPHRRRRALSAPGGYLPVMRRRASAPAAFVSRPPMMLRASMMASSSSLGYPSSRYRITYYDDLLSSSNDFAPPVPPQDARYSLWSLGSHDHDSDLGPFRDVTY